MPQEEAVEHSDVHMLAAFTPASQTCQLQAEQCFMEPDICTRAVNTQFSRGGHNDRADLWEIPQILEMQLMSVVVTRRITCAEATVCPVSAHSSAADKRNAVAVPGYFCQRTLNTGHVRSAVQHGHQRQDIWLNLGTVMGSADNPFSISGNEACASLPEHRIAFRRCSLAWRRLPFDATMLGGSELAGRSD
jgi:hypothetical protein